MGGEEGLGVTTGQPNLCKQDLSKLDVSKLTALSREVISRQATINIGTIGHVAHGKSTIVKAISGVQTVRFKNELERNITIKLDSTDGSSGESTDMLGANNEIPAVYHKRHLSPGSNDTLSSRSKPRLDESHVITKWPNNRNTSRFSSKFLKMGNALQQTYKVTYGISNCGSSNNTRDIGSDGKESDAESSDGRLSLHEDGYLRDFELKEARVLLHDIKHSKKYHDQMATCVQQTNKSIFVPAKSSPKLWEVEKIIQKNVRNGKEPLYLIKWKNWHSKYNTWEPLGNLTNCDDLLHEFEENRQKLIDLFKLKTNFYPDVHDAEILLFELRCKNVPIDNEIFAAESDGIYTDIQRYLKNPLHYKQEAKIKRQLLHELLQQLRREQLESLQDWENEINCITNGKPEIRVENLIDLEGAPQDFYYITNYLPGTDVIIPDDPPIGCECGVCDAKSNCCFAQNDQSLPYTLTCRVRVPPGTPIYECNKRCTCDINCPNRVVQRATNIQLCIFRTDNGRGWGVKTQRVIKRGTFITQYVGEVINSEEAEKRGKEYDATGHTYLFDLDYNDDQCPYTVDAAKYGNISHFINHSCDPNLAVYAVWINCLDPNLPNLALFAIKDIKQNEELTFDYTYQTTRGNEKMQQQLHNESNAADVILKNKTLCKCGAATCRQYLF